MYLRTFTHTFWSDAASTIRSKQCMVYGVVQVIARVHAHAESQSTAATMNAVCVVLQRLFYLSCKR